MEVMKEDQINEVLQALTFVLAASYPTVNLSKFLWVLDTNGTSKLFQLFVQQVKIFFKETKFMIVIYIVLQVL